MKQYKVKLYSNFTNLTTDEYLTFDDYVDEDKIIKTINDRHDSNIVSVVDIKLINY